MLITVHASVCKGKYKARDDSKLQRTKTQVDSWDTERDNVLNIPLALNLNKGRGLVAEDEATLLQEIYTLLFKH